MTPELDKAMNKAKITMMASKDSAFFVTVCLSLKHTWNPDIPTARTNGLEIQYNPDFFLSLDEDERLFLLLHETMHVVLMHMSRVGNRDPMKYNIAGDYVINSFLKDSGFKLPKGALYNPKYRDMVTEKVYDLLAEEDQPSGFQPDVVPSMSQAKQKQLEQDIEDILVKAAVQSEMSLEPGNMPAEVKRKLDDLRNPKLPWHVILRRFMNQSIKQDYSFKRPNKRFFPDVILPSAQSYGLDHIAIAIDVSGSISKDQFDQFITETHSIMQSLKPKKLTCLQFDTRISGNEEVESVQELLSIQVTGGGGTNINPVMEWTAENKPKLMLVFTDGYFRNRTPDPGVPVIWVLHTQDQSDFKTDYGKVIPFKD